MGATTDLISDSKRVLDPTDRFSEVVFGVMMALTFTGTVSVATAGRHEIREMLYAALGCNVAWGIVDAVMYVLTCLADRGRGFRTVRSIDAAPDAATGRRVVGEALPGGIASILPGSVLEGIRAAIVERAATLPRPRVTRDDLSGALAVFLLVVVATLPVTLPFVLLSDAGLALNVSKAVALVLLFVSGAGLGHYAGFGTWRSGFVVLTVGAVLVAVIIALGG
ncbi:MAG TPA: hypothetical protein VLK65_28985 [Vicinamibacteria bacterium]|nr:hypothetical protein [Vicinamibacteria bacterium]